MNEDIFDVAESERLKEEGIARARTKEDREYYLDHARRLAIKIAKEGNGLCNADQVAGALHNEGLAINEVLGHAAGALFKTCEWESTGLNESADIDHPCCSGDMWEVKDETEQSTLSIIFA